MNIYIRGEKLEITDAMKSYAKEKLERLSKYVKDSDVNANLLFKINGIKQKLEVTIPLKNFTLRVEEVGDDFYAVVDTAVDKLERQIRKNKTRLENKQVKSRIDFDYMSFDEKDEENANKIVRRKQVELKPMDEEEAILQMELLGHDFYVFKNIDKDGKISVLYRRKNNDYGLIEEVYGKPFSFFYNKIPLKSLLKFIKNIDNLGGVFYIIDL